MKKAFIALAFCLPIFITSCKKKDSTPNTPYGQNITGIQLRNVDASPSGTIGTLDTKPSSDSFQMVIFPTPASVLLNIYVLINNPNPITITAKLVYVNFPTAPPYWVTYNPYGYGDTTLINATHTNLAGTVASTLSQNISAAPPADTSNNGSGIHNPSQGNGVGGQSIILNMDVSDLPVGFYRVYIETSDGKQFWDNAWVLK